MFKHAILIFTSTACLLSGCALLPKIHTNQNNHPPPEVAYIPSTAGINSPNLLEFIGNFIELPIEAQRRELARINQTLLLDKSDIDNRMKVAMIYGFSSSRLRESAKAQILLDDLLREKTLNMERKALLVLLRDHLNENSKLSQRLRDEQKRADTLQSMVESLQQKLDETQKRADTLQKKLNDLKEIDKTMMNRKPRALQ
ncbi:MAG: hypothetical protein HOP04_14135 [Methylophilaceae bacterium]|nr:hypothetical protein [Methylophilaceae bacterium]